MTAANNPTETRQNWMGLLARAKPDRLAELLPDLPAHLCARSPPTARRGYSRNGAGLGWRG